MDELDPTIPLPPPSDSPRTGSPPSKSKGWQPPSTEELQAQLPQYEITALLGRGGMGAVYKGTQKNLDRPVAIKILPPDMDEDDSGANFTERFKNEARAMAKLSHPGIVAVFDFGETADGLLYIVMEFIEGTDVQKMVSEQGRLHSEHAMAITAHVCDALRYAHERGIIHRDIKPANIMVGYDGVVKVADFGLAKIDQGGTSGLTRSGMAMGTLHYMAPEALMLGSSVDQRADIYAVGVMLYYMLTGKLPQGMFELPSLQVPGLDPRYDGIIAKALRDDRSIRYQSTADLRRDLDGILTQPVVKVEAGAENAQPALPTDVRPQRAGDAQAAQMPKPRVEVRVEKRSSPLLWAALIAMGGGVLWTSLKKTPATTTGQKSAETAPSTPPDKATPAVAGATKDTPFVNSLGMKFVPVEGTEAFFCIHEVRYKDFAAFAAETPVIDNLWQNQTHEGYTLTERAEDHPVVKVSWEQAQKFCAWLSKKEARPYRLPTDREWSCAIGIGRDETWLKDTTPHTVLKNQIEFPWGDQWPPPKGCGNFGDESHHSKSPGDKKAPYIEGYDDGFPTTAPVMSFKPNKLGLYDLEGNVREWVEDWYDSEKKFRALRGGCWHFSERALLLSSYRNRLLPGNSSPHYGFRLALAVPQSTTKSVATLPNPAKTVTAAPAPPMPQPAPAVPATATKPATPSVNLPPELAALDAQFMQLQAERVTGPFETGVAQLNTGYLGGIARKIAEEKAAGHLDAILALEAEQKLLAAKQPVLEADDEKTPEALQALRTIYRDAYAKLVAARVENLAVLTKPLDKRLEQLEAQLTKADRLPDAKTVRSYREVLGGAVGSGFAGTVPPPPSLTPAATLAIKDGFTNSLGMKFVPVKGTDVFFCIHETRRQDFETFCRETSYSSADWRSQQRDGIPAGHEADHPVVGVSWNDAQAFCAWLTQKTGVTHRLPTDQEWSFAVGIGEDEAKISNATPARLSEMSTNTFPWNGPFPPSQTVGNLAGTECSALRSQAAIPSYNDGFVTTSPVMHFIPNQFGLFDLEGNVFEWCADWADETQRTKVLRGGSWGSFVTQFTRSGSRNKVQPTSRGPAFGFRVVVETSASSVPQATAPPPQNSPAQQSFTNSLGMKFASVPMTGTTSPNLMVSIWETREKDYETFVKETRRPWERPPAMTNGLEPAVRVSWNDAQAFCQWLTDRERRSKVIGNSVLYRLPTDHEWSCAIGVGELENAAQLPADKRSLNPATFPWGTNWPPPAGAGNYQGKESVINSTANPMLLASTSYDDGFRILAPVGSFTPNRFGLYDMGGNAWEWCEDWYDASQQTKVGRGSSFDVGARIALASSQRIASQPDQVRGGSGFRVVLAPANTTVQTTGASSSGMSKPAPPAAGQPFTNTLGMKFVPVPDTKVLMCIHETRRGDYAQFATAMPGRDESWVKLEHQGVPVGDKDDHPAAGISWDDARAFCAWLSTKEKRTYRLPTDREWSCAVGIGNEEARTPDATPEQLNQRIKNEYPWGKTYPPPDHRGNLADRECGRTFSKQTIIGNYNDSFATTAPVISFKPNAFGIYDLEGNVTEWCSDWHNEKMQFRVFRGGHWLASAPNYLLSSARMQNSGNVHGPIFGFRVVLEVAP